VSARLVLVSFAVTALVLLASWLLSWPLEKAALLAPVIVVFVAGALSLVALVAVLTLLGVQLPRE